MFNINQDVVIIIEEEDESGLVSSGDIGYIEEIWGDEYLVKTKNGSFPFFEHEIIALCSQ